MVPYRAELSVTFPARDQDHAGEIMEKLAHAVYLAGGLFEGGSAEKMADEDVVPDSPLAFELKRR